MPDHEWWRNRCFWHTTSLFAMLTPQASGWRATSSRRRSGGCRTTASQSRHWRSAAPSAPAAAGLHRCANASELRRSYLKPRFPILNLMLCENPVSSCWLSHHCSLGGPAFAARAAAAANAVAAADQNAHDGRQDSSSNGNSSSGARSTFDTPEHTVHNGDGVSRRRSDETGPAPRCACPAIVCS